jgi:hypothetical protein
MASPTRKAVPPKPVAPESDSEPRFWRWDVDGNRVDGTFVRAGEGFTKQGTRSPFVTLMVDDREVDVWVHHKALKSKIRQRIEEHGQIEDGERMIMERKPDKTTSADGYDYYPYTVEFPDLPQKDQADLFGAEKAEPKEAGGVAGDSVVDDDIPFMPA